MCLIVLATWLYTQYGSMLTLEALAARESALRARLDAQPLLIYGLAFAVYSVSTGLSLPGATALTLMFAWFFGFRDALILVSFASTLGATLAFLFSRFLFRDAVKRRFGERLVRFNAALQREGPFYLFTLRLIPAVPFFVINAVMGLTPMKTRTFWWVSQLGMLPGTIVYVYAGSRVPELATLSSQGVNAVFTPSQMTQILAALTLLGLFPWAVRGFVTRILSKPTPK